MMSTGNNRRKRTLILIFWLSFIIKFCIGLLDISEPVVLEMLFVVLSSLITSFIVILAVLFYYFLYDKIVK